MTWKEFYDRARSEIAFSDGSMGVFLQKYGLTGGDCPELWNVTHGDIIYNVHKSYIDAGSDLIITNTLGGNRVKLSEYGLEGRLAELNSAAVKLAKKAAGKSAIVTGDVGPTGKFVRPLGELTFDEMVDIYKEQVTVLADAGVDAIFFETHIDILELKAGIIACREACDLPIIASVTFEKDGFMVTGTSPEAAFTTLEALGADIIGTNCGTGAADMLKIIERAGGLVSAPVIAQANAGLPRLSGGKTVYEETPAVFVESALRMIEKGAHVIGGCCGTTPEHIRLLHDLALSQKPYLRRKPPSVGTLNLSSRYLVKRIGFDEPFTIIGERLNPTARKALAADIQEGAFRLFKDEALKQEEAGADVLDLNMGIPNADEKELISRGVEILSTSVKAPLAIDSSNAAAARAGLRLYPGKALLNSISAEPERLELLKDVKRYGAAFIALPITAAGIPDTAEKRVNIMRDIIRLAEKAGIDKKSIVADPLVLTVSAEQAAARVTLETIRRFRGELGLFTAMGLSNVSYGLPARGWVNRAFLSMAIQSGLTSAIANPFDAELVGLVRASDVLLGKDWNSKRYIENYSNVNIGPPNAPTAGPAAEKKEAAPTRPEDKLADAVVKGGKESVVGIIDECLSAGLRPFDLLDKYMIPAISRVGELYEKRAYFLPQLMLSAETMKAGFERLEPLLKSQGGGRKKQVVFATVKGDVHDIGKNIVILLLKNHGYEVKDLGKDVSNDVILKEALACKADVVALSALMTTTMPRMKEFMELIKKENAPLKVMVGGAAVTRVFAESIGAHYSADAVEAVKTAGILCGGK